MANDELFRTVGPLQSPPSPQKKKERFLQGYSRPALVLLALLVLCCFLSPLFLSKDPIYMDLDSCELPPDGEFLFGTDAMGRDIFSMIFSGGRLSLGIGCLSTVLSTGLAVLIGTLSALSPRRIDALITRFTDLFLCIPHLLLIVLLQAALGRANVWTLSLVLGLTGWGSMARVVRTEVLALREKEYVLASRMMGGGFLHILFRHLLPNLFPSILFMIVMNLRSAILSESTLSFLGLGLPLEVISWGSMLSLADEALLSGSWWIILIPGFFLTSTLLCITALGNDLRRNLNRAQRNL